MKIGLLGHGVVGKGVSRICDASEILQIKRILVKDDWELTDPRCTQNVQEILDDPEIDVVVECMGGIEPARSFLMKALQNGCLTSPSGITKTMKKSNSTISSGTTST